MYFTHAHTHARTHTHFLEYHFSGAPDSFEINKKAAPFFFISSFMLSEDVQSKCGLFSYLSLTWPGPARREAPGRQNSGSILPKTVPSLRCWSPSPSGLGAPAAGLKHLSSALGGLSPQKTRLRAPDGSFQVCVCVCGRGVR